MGWHIGVAVFFIFKYIMISSATDNSHHRAFALPNNNHLINEDDDFIYNNNNNIDRIGASNENNAATIKYQDIKLDELGRLLTNILIQPWPKGLSPIFYVEHYPLSGIQDNAGTMPDRQDLIEDGSEINLPYKRSRYYRKYPWKRQNSRYEVDNKYLCQPSKDDVYRLLVALHEARQGTKGQTVNFCNRKRPASVIFTNIRFLG